jgi:pilus assembly protein CpaF
MTIRRILGDRAATIPRGIPADVLEVELLNEAVALGPLEQLLVNEDVTEIMVNGASNVFVEQSGNLFRTDLTFADDAQVLKVMERIVAPIGRRIDESQPLVDARLPDGSRVNCIIPPLAIDGPTLTIRKFSKKPVTVDHLVGWGSTTHDILQFLRAAVIVRKNILVSGGTGSGKTTLLNVLSSFIPNNERIVTIEDAAELRLGQDHIVRLEARPPNIEGKGEIAIRELVRNSLRMRPDRIVVGECRSGEALDMLQAMNTGHDGSLTTVHANSPRDALSRLETLVLMAGFDLPLRAIREQVAAAISLIVQVSRMSDGTRKMLKVSEVTGMEGDIITTQDIFEYVVEGTDGEGAVQGYHDACGMVPTFAQAIALAGLKCDLGIFEKRN